MKTGRGALRTPQRNSLVRQSRKLRGPACCPACLRIRDRMPGASVALSGEFLAAHRDEILARVRACKGELEYRYTKDDNRLRVSWCR